MSITKKLFENVMSAAAYSATSFVMNKGLTTALDRLNTYLDKKEEEVSVEVTPLTTVAKSDTNTSDLKKLSPLKAFFHELKKGHV